MEWYTILLLLFSGMVLLLLTGLPVAFAFLVVNMVAAYFFLGGLAGLMSVATDIFSSITTFTLLPVPFFIFLGEIIFHTGVGLQAIEVIDDWLGRLPGRLSILAIITGVIFAALSGSTIANTALLGTVLVPEMQEKGYSKSMSLGPIMGIGGVAMLIPPSALAVVLASLAKMDVGRLLIAGVLPGVLMGLLYIGYVLGRCLINPRLAPAYHVPPVPLLKKIVSTVKYSLPIIFIIFMVTGVIFVGIATPTEAAATGTLGAFIVALVYRRLSWEALKKSTYGTIKITVMIFMIIIVSNTYSEILAFSGAASGLVEFAVGQKIYPIFIIISMMVTLILLGCFMETVSIMMITIPIFIPIVQALGYDPIWFGVLMMVNLELGMLSPPFGVLCFVMKGVSPEGTTMADIYKAALPFALVDILGLVTLILAPGISTYLPNQMGIR
jgi:tripartite ATP-independent transporter DctM subunit